MNHLGGFKNYSDKEAAIRRQEQIGDIQRSNILYIPYTGNQVVQEISQ